MPETDEGLHGIAATVVPLRDGPAGPEALLLERPSNRGSFAGAWVFPGGAVEPGDGADGEPESLVARRTAVRETLEETGLLIAEADLAAISTWTPPHHIPKRMRTWFFYAAAPDQALTLDEREVVDSLWIRPVDALERHALDTFNLIAPTWVTLDRLRGFASVADALAAAHASEPEEYVTRWSSDGTAVLWNGDVAYEDDALLGEPGGRHRLEIGSKPWRYVRG